MRARRMARWVVVLTLPHLRPDVHTKRLQRFGRWNVVHRRHRRVARP